MSGIVILIIGAIAALIIHPINCKLRDKSSYPCRSIPGLTANYARRETSIQEAPFLVRVEYKDNTKSSDETLSGGGIIIDERLVLTTAHICEISRANQIFVFPGHSYVYPMMLRIAVVDYDLHEERKGKYKRKTFDQHKDPKYNVPFYPMNFCLLRLSEPLQFGPTIQKAALASPGEALTDAEYYLPGWGDYKSLDRIQGWCIFAMEHQSVNPFYATLWYHMGKNIETEKCKENFKSVKNGGQDFRDEYFCLGYMCQDYKSAKGDDGGPVFSMRKQKVVGMVGWVPEWDMHETPSMNHKISYATEWINKKRNDWNSAQ